MYRYWDGHAWSAATSASPTAPPPNQGLGTGQSGGQQGQTGGQAQTGGQSQTGGQTPYGSGRPDQGQQYGQQPYGQQQGQFGSQQTAYQNYQQQNTKKKSTAGWWIAGGAVLVALIIIVVLVVRNLSGGSLTDPTKPGGGGSEDACPTTTPTAAPNTTSPDGRVHGGPVSYPRLPSPWGEPYSDTRVPFGSDVLQQTIQVEPDYHGTDDWVASILVAQLLAGDGFFTPEQGSEIVAKCVVGVFYGDNPVERKDQESKAMKVDGHKAWYLKTHLSFDIPGLRTKGETAIIVIVGAGNTSGLFYASIPDTAKQYLPDAEKSLKELTVDK